MTTVWGDYTATTSSGQQFRLAINYTISGTKVTISGYTGWSRGPVSDGVTLNRGGKGSGSISVNWSGTGNFNLGGGFSFTGTPGSSYVVTGSVTGLYNGLSPTVSATITIPASVPSAPGKPTISNITSTGCSVSFSASTNFGGASIDGYLLRYWQNTSASGTYTNHSTSTSRTRTVSGLIPGKPYTFAVYAHNKVGYSDMSSTTTINTKAGVWIKLASGWVLATPMVKYNGTWKNATPYIKYNGSWKNTG